MDAKQGKGKNGNNPFGLYWSYQACEQAPTELPPMPAEELPTEHPPMPPSDMPSEMPTELPPMPPSDMPSELPTALPPMPPSVMPSELPTELPPMPAMTEAQAKIECGNQCRAAGFCCNNPDVGSNQMCSCAQACMVRYYGASQTTCQALVDAQTGATPGQGGCSNSFQNHQFSFCSRCADLDATCPHGVQSAQAGHAGCGMSLMTEELPTEHPPIPPSDMPSELPT